jgi:hypothetical protein
MVNYFPMSDTNTSVVAPTAAAGPNTGGGGAAVVLFEEEVPVHVRNMDREGVMQPLGICVSTSRLGSARMIHVRLTDPRDPFFLYTMSLHEDDYGRFKDMHELRVDFGNFPRDLVAMLAAAQPGAFPGAAAGYPGSPMGPMMPGTPGGAIHSSTISAAGGHHLQHHYAQTAEPSFHAQGLDATTGAPLATYNGIPIAPAPHVLSFVVQDGTNGTLRIMERTAFRALEHLSLQLVRQGDVGQKQHLAERFHFFQAQFLQTDAARRSENEYNQRRVNDLEAQLAAARGECQALQQEAAVASRDADAAATAQLTRLKDAHAEELRRLHAAHDADRALLVRERDADAQRTRTDAGKAEESYRQLVEKLRAAEALSARLQRDLELQTAQHTQLRQDHDLLVSEREDLQAFRRTATTEKVQADLHAATTHERLTHYEDLVRRRDEELQALRKHAEALDGTSRRLAEQLDDLKSRHGTATADLAKAHHIIAAQLQAIRSAKEKHTSVQHAQTTAEKQAQDKGLEVERLRLEQQAAKDRIEGMERNVQQLKDQLTRAEEANAALGAELRQNKDALLHMGRQVAAGPGAGLSLHRTWATGGVGGAFSGNTTLNATSASALGGGAGALGSSGAAGLTGVLSGIGGAAATSTAASSAGAGGSSLLLGGPTPAAMMREFARGHIPTSSASGAPLSSRPAASSTPRVNSGADALPTSSATGSAFRHLAGMPPLPQQGRQYMPPTSISGSPITGGSGHHHGDAKLNATSSSSVMASIDPIAMLRAAASGSAAGEASSYFP